MSEKEPITHKKRTLNKEIETFEKGLSTKIKVVKQLSEDSGTGYIDREKLEKALKEHNVPLDNEFEEEEEVITRSEIIARSPYRYYYEEEALSQNHLVFLHFYKKCNGNISKVCDRMRITRHKVASWRKENELFNLMMEEINEGLIDNTEDALHGLIKSGNPLAVMFFLKCKAKDRGYVEKQVVETHNKIQIQDFEYIDINDEKEEVKQIPSYTEAELYDDKQQDE